MINFNINKPPQGWVCPKCGRVYAPFVAECHSCNQAIGSTNIAPTKVIIPTDPNVVKPSATDGNVKTYIGNGQIEVRVEDRWQSHDGGKTWTNEARPGESIETDPHPNLTGQYIVDKDGKTIAQARGL